MRKIAPYIVAILIILLVFGIMGKLDRAEENQPETETQAETVIETVEEPKVQTTEETEIVKYDPVDYYVRELTPIVMSAAGCTNYESKYKVACVLRNRKEKYGMDSPLFWEYIEPPFRITDETDWELETRQEQWADCERAIRQAFTEPYYNTSIFYYCVPDDCSEEGWEFFKTLTFVCKADVIYFYKEADNE